MTYLGDKFQWSGEAEVELRRLVDIGGAYSSISRALSEMFLSPVTRNACIGKAKRLGLCKPAMQKPPTPRKPRAPRNRAVLQRTGFGVYNFAAQSTVSINDLPEDHSDFAVPFMRAIDGQCRWPLGEPTADMIVCGAVCEGSYCLRHRAVAYRPAKIHTAEAA